MRAGPVGSSIRHPIAGGPGAALCSWDAVAGDGAWEALRRAAESKQPSLYLTTAQAPRATHLSQQTGFHFLHGGGTLPFLHLLLF